MTKKFIWKIKTYLKKIFFKIFTLQRKNIQAEQIIIANQYCLMKNLLKPSDMPSLQDVGFRVHSQFEEDGILLYIFSLIGVTNKRVVEIWVGDGTKCMAANLIINHGWEGLLFDGDQESVNQGVDFYRYNPATFIHPPIFKQAWLTRENVDKLIEENGFNDEIDLLSIDIDGNDYYIMEAINVIKPRVIICETNNVIPSHLALTIPYKSDFSRNYSVHPDFVSVSLLAMKKLLNKKGYRLIGSHKYWFNVIFILNDLGNDYFPEKTIETIHNNPYTQIRRQKSWEKVRDLPWVSV